MAFSADMAVWYHLAVLRPPSSVYSIRAALSQPIHCRREGLPATQSASCTEVGRTVGILRYFGVLSCWLVSPRSEIKKSMTHSPAGEWVILFTSGEEQDKARGIL
jgi:hypothetical protein